MPLRTLIIALCLVLAACSQEQTTAKQPNARSTTKQDRILTVHTTEVTMNGKTLYLTDIHDPIMDRPLAEIQRLADKRDPAAMNELSLLRTRAAL